MALPCEARSTWLVALAMCELAFRIWHAACRNENRYTPENSMLKIARKHGLAALALTAMGLAAMAPAAHAGKTLDAVKARGQLVCGVSSGVAGFSQADSAGKWTGLDVDVCRDRKSTRLNSSHW